MRYSALVTLFYIKHGQKLVNSSEWGEAPQECGKTRFKNREARTTLPGKAAIGQFPWVVRVGYYWYKDKLEKHEKKEVQFMCGGSLISKHYVLTATKCGRSAEMVRVGESDLGNKIDCDECDNTCAPPYQDVGINRRLRTMECSSTKTNDICVLELKRAIQFNDFVRPICIPKQTKTRSSSISGNIVAMGWGTMMPMVVRPFKTDNEPIIEMMYFDAPVASPKDCNDVYVRKLQKSQICVGYPKNAPTTCIGDFGGGLVGLKKVGMEKVAYLEGIATHSLSNCNVDKLRPVIYTDVSHFSDWIVRTIKEAISTRGPDKEEDDDENVNPANNTKQL